MGNSAISTLKAAIINNNIDQVQSMLERPSSGHLINELINRRGDTPLLYSASLGRTEMVKLFINAGSDVNHINLEKLTALDLAIRYALPPDGDIVRRYRLDSQLTEGSGDHEETSENLPIVDIPEIVSILIEAGAQGKTLERLILYVMREKDLVRKIINSIDNLNANDKFRISGLLLQVSVWFDQQENVRLLLDKGVSVHNFWSASFMPKIEPSNPMGIFNSFSDEDDIDEDEYYLSTTQTSDSLQELKFMIVQEWWADWNDGENPAAQFRAGLQLTPECALFFVKTANSITILDYVVEDIMQYLPIICSGPNIGNSCLLNCLTMAGYVFHEDQQQHLSLKFNVDFEPHKKFNREPKKLRYICRISLRLMFNTNVHSAVDQLKDLPRTLQGFLLLEDDIHL